MYLRRMIGIVLLAAGATSAQTTDTLSLTLQQADKRFLENNLDLLASQYNIALNDAAVVQAKLYPNPVFTADFNVYDPDNQKTFHVDRSGEKAFALEQVILLGGKRKSEIALARQNSNLAKLEFEDLLRNLKYQLHTSFYEVRQQQVVLKKFNEQLKFLDTIISNYEVQVQKGNLPVKEVVRLKAVYLSLNNERAELLSNQAEEMVKLRLLLRTESYVHPLVRENESPALSKMPTRDELLALANEKRPDVKIAALQNDIAGLNLRYQKQQAIPDITLNTSYDQRGGAFNNQVNGGFSIPLPLWNRNKGNIQSARTQTDLARLQQQQKELEVQTEVTSAYDELLRSIREYRKSQQLYNSDFETVFHGVSDNFQKRNISLLEFVDFIESYNESIAELERIKMQLALATEKINFVTTTEVY